MAYHSWNHSMVLGENGHLCGEILEVEVEEASNRCMLYIDVSQVITCKYYLEVMTI